MEKEVDIEFLKQLTESLEKSLPRLETSYKHQSIEDFDKIKKLILTIQKKIQEALE
jgi:hypothetical protein